MSVLHMKRAIESGVRVLETALRAGRDGNNKAWREYQEGISVKAQAAKCVATLSCLQTSRHNFLSCRTADGAWRERDFRDTTPEVNFHTRNSRATNADLSQLKLLALITQL